MTTLIHILFGVSIAVILWFLNRLSKETDDLMEMILKNQVTIQTESVRAAASTLPLYDKIGHLEKQLKELQWNQKDSNQKIQ